jgi:hypothetical protein
MVVFVNSSFRRQAETPVRQVKASPAGKLVEFFDPRY